MQKWLIGIDEAGRGPLAGPVAVGVVLIPLTFDWKQVPGVTDSKLLSHKKREEIHQLAKQLTREGSLQHAVTLVGERVIDERGIVHAVRLAMARSLNKLRPQFIEAAHCRVLLDGSLKAPAEFTDQSTIIKGDQSEPVIGLASILAKVTRDRYMVRQAKRYPAYGFEQHKGYATKLHRESLKNMGLCPIHRRTFCHID